MVQHMDPEYAEATAAAAKYLDSLPKLAVGDVAARRARWDPLVGKEPTPSGVVHDVFEIPGPDGNKVAIYRWKGKHIPSNTEKPGAAVLHMHAGGYILLTPAASGASMSQLALRTDVTIFSVDYRLAPEHRYPAAIEDCWSALNYIMDNAASLGIDKDRIGLLGESAGGGMVAALAQMARDRGLQPQPRCQIIAYPMLDDVPGLKDVEGAFHVWLLSDNETAWDAYLGKERRASGDIPTYAAPARAKDLTGLPPMYMDFGQLDLFAKQDYEYAGRCVAAGIDVELHMWPGLTHAFNTSAPEISASKAFYDNRVRLLKRL